MRALDRLAASLVHECGTRIDVPADQIEQPYRCHGCGKTDQIDPASVPGIMADIGVALMEVDRRIGVGANRVSFRLDRKTGTFCDLETARG